MAMAWQIWELRIRVTIQLQFSSIPPRLSTRCSRADLSSSRASAQSFRVPRTRSWANRREYSRKSTKAQLLICAFRKRSNHLPLPEGRIGLRARWVMRGYQGRVDKPARRIHRRDVRRMRCAYPPYLGMPGARLHTPWPAGVPRGHKGKGWGEGGAATPPISPLHANRSLTSRFKLMPDSAASTASMRWRCGGMRTWNLPE